jgi:hypothetical protein
LRYRPAIAVIGAGFSGTLLALHLLRRCPDAVRIHLIERRPRFGRRLAYSSGNLNHLLNVPTSRMSAFHDRPGDFLDWLQREGEAGHASVTSNAFVSRKLFGDYVRHHLKREFRRAAGSEDRLILTRGEVVDLQGCAARSREICRVGGRGRACHSQCRRTGQRRCDPFPGHLLQAARHGRMVRRASHELRHGVVYRRGDRRSPRFTLNRNGFQLIKAPTAVTDFYSPEEIKRVYYPEVARLLQHKLGASRIFVFDHNVRNATRPGLAVPSRQVHNDHTVNSAPRRVRDHLGADAEALLQHRFGIVNVWRPIRGPVLDSPLALCDARSFTDDDLIASDLVYAHVRGETSSVAYNPAHRWYYFSEMQPDEVVLIRVHDSANDGRARLSFHTSFDNPLTPGAPPRESIEVRTLVFFPSGN